VILIFLGTGPVKGFGVTLTIGVSVSMFTALVVTRLIFDFLLARGWLKSCACSRSSTERSGLHPLGQAGLHHELVADRPGLRLRRLPRPRRAGRGLRGGDKLTLRYDASQTLDLQKVRQVVEGVGVKDFFRRSRRICPVKSVPRGHLAFETGLKVESALTNALPEMKFEKVQMDTVGPVVGAEIQKTAVIAALVPCLASWCMWLSDMSSRSRWAP